MIDVLKIHSKSLRYTIGKLTEAWRTPNSCDSSVNTTLCKKCPNTEFFLVRIFPHSDQKKTPYLDTFHAVPETDADLYQHLWWSDFYFLLLVLLLLQENIFRNTFGWLLLKRKNDIFNNHNVNHKKRYFHGSKNLQ